MQSSRLAISIAISIFVLVVLSSGCSGLIEPTITVVVPDGFAGPILVLEDPKATAYPEGRLSYQVEIPQSGVLFVKSAGFLKQSASWVVRRKNGDLIPLDYEGATDGQVAMRFGGWRSWNGNPGRLEHFVGTSADFEKCDFSLIPTPEPLGTAKSSHNSEASLLTQVTGTATLRLSVSGSIAAPHVAFGEMNGECNITRVAAVRDKDTHENVGNGIQYKVEWKMLERPAPTIWIVSPKKDGTVHAELEQPQPGQDKTEPDAAMVHVLEAMLRYDSTDKDSSVEDAIEISGKSVSCIKRTTRTEKRVGNENEKGIYVRETWMDNTTILRTVLGIYSNSEVSGRCILQLELTPIASSVTSTVEGEAVVSGEGGKALFTFTTDEKYEVFKRPLIRFTPPKDKNGKRPHEVIAAFLAAVQDQKYEVAEECVNLLPNRTGPSEPVAISQEEFHRCCDRYLQYADGGNVVLAATAINSKEEFWGVSYRLQTRAGDVRWGGFDLEQQGGEWKIMSSESWHQWAGVDYDLEKAKSSKDGRVPHW